MLTLAPLPSIDRTAELIRLAIQTRIEEVIKSECDAAAKRVTERIRGETGNIAARVLERFRLECFGNELRISVDFQNVPK